MIKAVFELFIKYRILISIMLISSALATLIFWPELSRSIGMTILLANVCMAMATIARNHWRTYEQAECSLGHMTRNLSLDMLGLLLIMAAASFAGGAAGQWAGIQAGLWAGLLEGFVVGFLAALVVRSAWGKLVGVLA